MLNNKLAVIALSVLIALLSGCGGGGVGAGSSAGTSPATQFPIASALSAYSQASHNFTLSATDGANTITLQITETPGAASTFNGQAASLTITNSGIISVNGVVASTVNDESYLNTSPYESIGDINLGNGQYMIYANQQTLPTYATVGQSGPLDTSTTYTDNTKAVVYGNDTETWSLLSDTVTTAWLCDNDTQTVVGSAPAVITNCYQIDTTGNVLAMKVTMPINGTTLTFK